MYEQVFIFFSLLPSHHSLAFPCCSQSNPFFPKPHGKRAETEAKQRTLVHNTLYHCHRIATHSHNTTPSAPKLNTQKYHTFISLTHPIYPLLNLTPSPIVPTFIPQLRESDEAHSWMAKRIGWRGELREQRNKNRESLIESGLIFDIRSDKIGLIVTLRGRT